MRTADQPKQGTLIRFITAVTLRGPSVCFERWLGRKLKIDLYRFVGEEVFAPGGRSFRLADVRSWREVFIGGGVPLVVTEFSDGRQVDWSDKYEHLARILRFQIPERELPWQML